MFSLIIVECSVVSKLDIDLSHVRKQTGSSSSDDKTKVQEWRSALAKVVDFSGWNSKDRWWRNLQGY
ncbi:hypothetical protein ACE6H2_023258 [Prunus campanulata]